MTALTARATLATRIGFTLLVLAASAGVLTADTGANHQTLQTRPIQLGTSGGNINDHSRSFCCSGTLGALVTKNGVQYVLSNNHVLARTNAGGVGDDIVQPGLIDETPVCSLNTAHAVADLSQWAQISFRKGTSNVVDAAIAEVRAGDVTTDGSILDIGVPSATPALPAVGTPVQKSGRTTGLTAGTIAAVDVTINVRYGSQCGGGRGTATFRNQIRVTPGTFSAGGDSGSLIVTTGTPAQPVALLFAGSSTDTFANPVQDVLNAFAVTVVGATTTGERMQRIRSWLAGLLRTSPAQAAGPTHPIHPDSEAKARRVKARHENALLAIPGVHGVGVGASPSVAGEAVIEVYVDKATPAMRASVPATLDDVHVEIVETGEIHARGGLGIGK